MQIQRKTVDGMLEELTLSIKLEDYQQNVIKELKKLRQREQVPGFRQGNAPMQLIEKKYKKAVVFEEVEKQADEYLNSYLKDNNIRLLIHDITPNEEDIKKLLDGTTTDYELHYNIVVVPELNTEISKQDKLSYSKVSLTNEDIENLYQQYRKRWGTYKEVESIEDNDFLKVSIKQVNVDEGTTPYILDDSSFLVSSIKDENIKKQLIGKKVNYSFTANLKQVFEVDEARYILKFQTKEDERLNGEYECTVKKIQRHFPAEENQDFFAKFGKNINSIELVKETIKKNEEFKIEYYCDNKFSNDVRKYLLEKYHSLSLPEDFLFNYAKAGRKKDEPEINKEDVIEQYKFWTILINFQNQCKWELNQTDITNNLKVRERIFLSQYGMEFIDDETLTQIVNERIQRHDSFDAEYATLIRYMSDYIKSNATIDYVDMTYDELLKKP